MKTLGINEFKTYEEEAEYWDTLDTASFMEDDEEKDFLDEITPGILVHWWICWSNIRYIFIACMHYYVNTITRFNISPV